MSSAEKKHFVLNRFFKQLKKTDRLLLVGFLVVFIFVGVSFVLLPTFFFKTPERISSDLIQKQVIVEPSQYRHPLTGVSVDQELQPPQVFSVMIDNHEDAWPPSGIEEAFLVVE